MSTDLLEHASKKIIKSNIMKASVTKSLDDRVALQLLEQKDNGVIVFNVPTSESNETRMKLIRRIYRSFDPMANIISIYPARTEKTIFGKETVDKFYAYQHIKSDCLYENVHYPKTTMYVIEFRHNKELHFPNLSGETHWTYLDQFKDEHFN